MRISFEEDLQAHVRCRGGANESERTHSRRLFKGLSAFQLFSQKAGIKNLQTQEASQYKVEKSVDEGLDEIIKDMQSGFLVTGLIGSGVNIVNGDYSRGLMDFGLKTVRLLIQ